MLRRLLTRKSKTQVQEPDWEAIYRDTLPRIYRFFCYRVNDGPTAEDLTSATFEKAWRARARYRHDLAAFSTWVFAIARNVATDHFRKQAVQREVPLDELHLRQSAGPSVDEVAQQRFDFAALAHVLATLTDRERDVLSLKYGAEMNHKTIAGIMGLSESNVAVITHRALHTLRSRWAGPSPFGEAGD